ncbi:MAG: polyphosphate kinase 2 family protein [Planctomycetota bacterium]
MDVTRYRVAPGTTVRLSNYDPDDKALFEGEKKERPEEIARINTELERLQELLYAEAKHRLLIVLQAPDTGGKDGVIRQVFDGVNPQGVAVTSFKQPSSLELAHDYLWRYHMACPVRGQIMIFNRSHYEEVLVVRVHNLVPEAQWRLRYDHINHFERMLTDEGVTILKFFLHISQDEQKMRLQSRLDDPQKRWKFSVKDVRERGHWSAYQEAFETMLSLTSTEHAPWHVIPANRKWYRDLVVSHTIVQTLQGFGMSYPDIESLTFDA